MEWLFEYVDTLDIVVLTGIALIAAYFYSNYRSDTAKEAPQPTTTTFAAGSKTDRSFLGTFSVIKNYVLSV